MKSFQELQKLDRVLRNFRKSGVYQRHRTPLNDADIMILFCIAFCDKEPHKRMSEIARTLGLTLPAITHKVNDLVEKGYVVKTSSNEDLRVTNVVLTEAGLAFVNRIKDHYYQPLQALTECLGEEETDHLIRLLEKANQMKSTKKDEGSR